VAKFLTINFILLVSHYLYVKFIVLPLNKETVSEVQCQRISPGYKKMSQIHY